MNKLGLGTVQFGLDYGVSTSEGRVPSNEVTSILNYASDKRIEMLDTAPSYGESEKVLGSNLVNNFKIVTKTQNIAAPKVSSSDVKLIDKIFMKSLKNLNINSAYGLLVHDVRDLLKFGSEKLYGLLTVLKKEQKIRKLGVSIYDKGQLESILDLYDIDLVQLPLNILDRRLIDSDILTRLKNRGVEIHVRSVFLQGLLLMPKNQIPDKFVRWKQTWNIWHEWLADNEISALEASLRYAVAFPEVSKVLVGVESLNQLKEISRALDGALPDLPENLQIDDIDLLNPTNWSNL
tara:strand:+ start:9367 stop:10242 length:876 start_codon:yes stop_codon:yes gene_type:complete